MWPWAHLAVGYLLYAGYVRYRESRVPADAPALALALGTLLPDLVDKPLGWSLGVLPGGRSLGHSLLVAGLALAVLSVVVRRRRQVALLVAGGVGHASHLVADAIAPLASGEFVDLAFLLWPVVALPASGSSPGLLAVLSSVSVTPYFLVQLGLTVAATAVWVRDGRPGLAPVVGWLARRREPSRPEEAD